MRKPDIRCVIQVVKEASECSAGLPDGRYVPARSLTGSQLNPWGRWKAAWLVFTGKADALTFPGQ